ncbi:MAG: hypothetical protein KA085_09150 [Phenylobacterium sp.]|uniref:hypothetical protein n=1 Tax=Phenylobacterium sp. TaxID=1871053 RepID=UPI001B57384B|nr:hypothetical protein [Phenylobacterium sp.]MBP7649172.1 hypothetical protein [Phenylobacterium sp.]MBP7816280.1 hypothetical protein [Phenylobacterium sp.]MBP9230861.1 hypothetical protein [Phenylobacterium sp.]MBP9754563.1 hypothetical protein [Phenylobacterium sp.]
MLQEEIGDRASEIIWRGRQWIVTNFGLETLGDPFPYEVAATRLTEGWQGADESLLAWPMELAAKTWIDYRDFVTAYLVALGVHQEAYSPVDVATIKASLNEGRAMWEATKAEMLGEFDDD